PAGAIAPRTAVAPHFPRDRRRRPTKPAPDRAERLTTRQAPRDLFAFDQRQPQPRPLRFPLRRPLQPVDISPDRPPRPADLLVDHPRRSLRRPQLCDPFLLTFRQPFHTAPPDPIEPDRGCCCVHPLRPRAFCAPRPRRPKGGWRRGGRPTYTYL